MAALQLSPMERVSFTVRFRTMETHDRYGIEQIPRCSTNTLVSQFPTVIGSWRQL